jgi:hypothetical protein
MDVTLAPLEGKLKTSGLLTSRIIKLKLLPSSFERQKIGKKKSLIKKPGLKGEHT